MNPLLTEIAEVLSGERRWCVINADCMTELPTLPDKSVAHVITDPPYSEHVHAKQWVASALTKGASRDPSRRSKFTEIGFDHLSDVVRRAVAAELGRVATRWVLAFSDLEGCHLWRSDLEASGLQYVRTGIWHKTDAAPQFTGDRPGSGAEAITIAHPQGRKRWNGGGRKAVFEHCINNYGRSERHHPTPKPPSLMLELIGLFTDLDDVVLDPFAGSCTTGVACLRLGRRFIGIERDPDFYRVGLERMGAESQGLTLRAARAGQIHLGFPLPLPPPAPVVDPEPEPWIEEETA